MNPSLWPDLTHLPVWAVVVCIAGLCIGIGSWVGARRAETALVAGWGVAGAATAVVGTLLMSGLGWVMLALAVAGLAGLVRIVIGSTTMRSAMLARVVLLALPLAICIEGMDITGWDDFSHWLPNLTYLSLHGHFPTLVQPSTSVHAAYPYALALPGYAYFLLFNRVPADAALIWNFLLMLAAGATVATVLLARLQANLPEHPLQSWATAAIGLLIAGLAAPSFVAKIVFSNMADAPTASVLAVMGLLLFDWVIAARDRDAQGRTGAVWALAFAGVALIDLRQANAPLFAWLIFGCLLAGVTRPRWLDVRGLASLALIAVVPFAVWFLWNNYATTQIPGGQFYILPLRGWRWAEFPTTLHSMLRVMLSKFGLFSVILLITIRAVLSFRRTDELGAPSRAVLITAAVVCVSNVAFLAFTYLAADFNKDEAAAAVSFWRYATQTGPIAVLGVAAGLPLNWMRRIPAKPAAVALIVLALILPVATVKFYRFDLASSVPMLRSAGRATAESLPPRAPITVVDLTGDGFAPLVVAYQIGQTDYARGLPARPFTIVANPAGITPAEAAKLHFEVAPYLWLTEGAPELQPILGVHLAAGCSYLLQHDAGRFAIIKSWPLSRYLNTTQRSSWSPATGAPCT
ncbi:MAG TPA: hypothetical protein VKQ27_13060 [Acetobacteraceae bacterium]|nr:hypothetical protein [Acetobacteraceae bacterium]